MSRSTTFKEKRLFCQHKRLQADKVDKRALTEAADELHQGQRHTHHNPVRMLTLDYDLHNANCKNEHTCFQQNAGIPIWQVKELWIITVYFDLDSCIAPCSLWVPSGFGGLLQRWVDASMTKQFPVYQRHSQEDDENWGSYSMLASSFPDWSYYVIFQLHIPALKMKRPSTLNHYSVCCQFCLLFANIKCPF